MANPSKKTSEVTLEEITSNTALTVPDVEPFFPFDDTVTVLVGPEKERFSIHKRLICQYPFFTAAYDGAFEESAAGTLKLPEHDPFIFRFFIYWLYTGKLDGHHYPATAKPSISDVRKESKIEWQGQQLPHFTAKSSGRLTNDQGQLYRLLTYRDAPFDALVGLYLLAEYLQIPGLRDEVINVLVDVYAHCDDKLEGVLTSFWCWRNYSRPHWAPDPIPSINAAWKSSSKDSKLCQLLVTLFCDHVVLSAEEMQENERLNTEFLSAAFTTAQERWIRGLTRTKWQTADALCLYHDHDGHNCNPHKDKIAKAER
ncbi:MAG: hypothetical protein Q9166_005713 [cf. Caloplaca sp. 2 TL-2023]